MSQAANPPGAPPAGQLLYPGMNCSIFDKDEHFWRRKSCFASPIISCGEWNCTSGQTC